MYEIVLTHEAVDDLRTLSRYDRTKIEDALETHLRHEPMKISRSRIKRMRDLAKPQYRLRVDEWRVYYDVTGQNVVIHGVIPKDNQDQWLAENGILELEDKNNEADLAGGGSE